LERSPPGYADYAILCGLAIIFGSSFIFTSISVRDLPPITVAAGRLSIAALLMLMLMHFKKQSLPAPGRIWIFIATAAFFGNALPFALVSWGQVKVDAGLAAIFMAIMPLITVVLAHMFTVDEKMSRLKLIGVFSGLLGVVVLIGWDKLGGLGDDMLRQYAILFAAFCYSINAIITKYLTAIPRVPMMTALLLVAAFMLLPFVIWLDKPWQLEPSLSSVGSVLVLALGPTALATLIILHLIGRQGASFLSQINFLVPLAGVFFGWVLLGETLPANAWVALTIILLGIAASRLGTS